MSLQRFHKAQAGAAGYEQALKELKAGKKTSHWIWYVFPQLKVLGYSPNAKFFGIEDLNETCAYLQDPLLFDRYLSMTSLVATQLKKHSLYELMGGNTDAQKLLSSITLFAAAAAHLDSKEKQFGALKEHCRTIFSLAALQGYTPCEQTTQWLKPISIDSKKRTNDTKTSAANTQLTFFKTEAAPRRSSAIIKLNEESITERQSNQPLKQRKARSILATELDAYIALRNNEGSFHYNFLGIMAFIYYIQDTLSGTKYFSSKSREIKINAALKVKQAIESSAANEFTKEELSALNEGRLGALMTHHGGLDSVLLLQHGEESHRPLVQP